MLRMTGDYHLACDLVQESFVRYLQRYSSNRTASRSLLYTIGRNAAMDVFRKPRTNLYDSEAHGDLKNNPEQRLEDRQAYTRMMDAICKLPALDRELIALVAGGDLSYRQIGKVLKISEANVKVKVHRARLKLKETLAFGG